MAGNAGGTDSSKYKSQAAVLLWNPNEESGCISNMVDNTSDATAALQESQKLASFGGILKEDGFLDIGVDRLWMGIWETIITSEASVMRTIGCSFVLWIPFWASWAL